ncbi:MAG: hypothetical protein ACJATT_004059 [Myxococcota bacterium]|jgi:hypothetical protein
MSGEGLSKMVSAEFIRATVTLIPVLLAMWWVLKLQGMLWRRTVWAAVGVDARLLEAELGVCLSYRWTGYQLAGEGWRVRWVGGLRGETTSVKVSGDNERVSGFLDADAIRKAVNLKSA